VTIWVSSLFEARRVALAVRPARAVSLLSPGDDFPVLPGLSPDRHHCAHLDDIREEIGGRAAPARAHVDRLIDFLSDHQPDSPLLIHCFAGVSRSTAAAYIAACLFNPQTDEKEIAGALRLASPTAFPNSRIIAFADDALGRGGRMTAAVEGMGRGSLADWAAPFSMPGRF
jgi:predicted protein tyrosine phosphatase